MLWMCKHEYLGATFTTIGRVASFDRIELVALRAKSMFLWNHLTFDI